jgi:ABC-2 type transport system ATP-binding protein
MDDIAIKVENLHKSFADMHVVRGFSFDVRRGEVFSLLGPNGAGQEHYHSMGGNDA